MPDKGRTMQRRGVATGVAAAAVLVLSLPPIVAHAAGTGVITSPSSGAVLTAGTPLQVEVSGRAGGPLDPSNHTVQVRLATLSGAEPLPGTSPVDLSCSANCNDTSTWTGPTFDPATLAPFAQTTSCNGGYVVQVRVDGGAWSGHGVRISRPASAPKNVAVTPQDGTAKVTWTAAGEPDVAAYRVQRRPAGGSWGTVTETAATATSVVDTTVAPGDVEYRVASLRGDGVVGGRSVAPCADDEPDLVRASAPVSTTIAAPPSEDPDDEPAAPSRPTPTTDTTGGGSGDGAGGTGDGTSGTGDGTGDGSVTDDGAEEPGGDDVADGEVGGVATEAGTGTSRRSGSRIAPPSTVGVLDVPEVGEGIPAADEPQVAGDPQGSREESYYGEDLPFSDELDFGALGEVNPLPEGASPTAERTVRVPGALQSILGRELDLQRILGPIGAGLIMLAIGLHLRRWLHDTD